MSNQISSDALAPEPFHAARAGTGEEVLVVVNQTPFYGESGGQVGDSGTLTGDHLCGQVLDTSKQLGKLFVHRVQVEDGELAVGDTVKLAIDVARRVRSIARRTGSPTLISPASTCV